jgi:hypothetical protein
MKLRIHPAIAALVAAGSLTFAHAQGATLATDPPANLVSEPVATASAASGSVAEAANPIVQALNAEASLKGSKLTVVPDGEVVFLTGVTLTRDQMKLAMQIAAAQAGEGKAANAIQPQELVIVTDPDAEQAGGTDATAAVPAGATTL